MTRYTSGTYLHLYMEEIAKRCTVKTNVFYVHFDRKKTTIVFHLITTGHLKCRIRNHLDFAIITVSLPTFDFVNSII